MKAQSSSLIALALLGASMSQLTDAAVCPDACVTGGREGVKMCIKRNDGRLKNKCVPYPKKQRNVLKKGGSCGKCGDTSSPTCPAKFACNNRGGSLMCIENSKFGSTEVCVERGTKVLMGKCGPCSVRKLGKDKGDEENKGKGKDEDSDGDKDKGKGNDDGDAKGKDNKDKNDDNKDKDKGDEKDKGDNKDGNDKSKNKNKDKNEGSDKGNDKGNRNINSNNDTEGRCSASSDAEPCGQNSNGVERYFMCRRNNPPEREPGEMMSRPNPLSGRTICVSDRITARLQRKGDECGRC